MENDADLGTDTWGEIEDAIVRQLEKKLAVELSDVRLAEPRAREFAADAVQLICSILGGHDVYVPKLARRHRKKRDTEIRKNFKGVFKDTARETGLSVRQVRNILHIKN